MKEVHLPPTVKQAGDPRKDYDFNWKIITDGTDHYRVCFGEEVGKPGRFLVAQKYSRVEGWQHVDMVDKLPFELCGAYWAPSQGGACDLPMEHKGNHHV